MIDWDRLKDPRFWVQIHPTNQKWDDTLNRALDEYGVREITQYTAKVGPFTVWVANWPHSYGSLYAPFAVKFLPKVATRKRLQYAVQQAAYDLAFERMNRDALK